MKKYIEKYNKKYYNIHTSHYILLHYNIKQIC